MYLDINCRFFTKNISICRLQVSFFFLLFLFFFVSLINADFCCAGSLIAYGALLGKVSPVQLLVVTLFGVTLFAVEEYIILDLLHVSAGHTWSSSPGLTSGSEASSPYL